MNSICNWYQSFAEENAGLPGKSVDLVYSEVFWDIHDALPLAMQGCQAGWDTLRTVGTKRRVLSMMQDPRGFVILLCRVTWLYEFPTLTDPELSGADVARIPEFVQAVLRGLEGTAEVLFGRRDHPLIMLLQMMLRRELTAEVCHSILEATMTYLSSLYQAEHMANNALQLQILFSAALTMLQQYEHAEQLLHDVQAKAEAAGDPENYLAAYGILGIVRGFQLRFEEAKELVLRVVTGARTGVLYGSDSHRYSICAAARLCKVLGQFEEAEKLYEEAIPLGQMPGNRNMLYHINMVRNLHRLFMRRENFGGARHLKRQYPQAFVEQNAGRESRL